MCIRDRNWPFCIGYSLCKVADFQSCLISGIYWVFFGAFFFVQNNSNDLLEWFVACFWHFKIFWPKLTICTGYSLCMGYSLCKMADFQSCLISGIFGGFSSRFFAQNNSNVLVECYFACFCHFYFLTQTDHFAWAIAFARWPIFNICLISRIFFPSCFFPRITRMFL